MSTEEVISFAILQTYKVFKTHGAIDQQVEYKTKDITEVCYRNIKFFFWLTLSYQGLRTPTQGSI